MLTIEQCRGARGLLGWTQQDLADASGLSKTAINNFEKGHSDIKFESLRAIRMAFESAEIEFMAQDGIRRKSENVRLFKGTQKLGELLNDIHKTLTAQQNSEILISNVDGKLSGQISTQRLFDHIDFLKNTNTTQRVLCAEGTKNVLSPQDECRWLPESEFTGRIASFIYGSKVAFKLWDHSMIIVINSPEVYETELRRFEKLWNEAAIPPWANKTEKPASAKLQKTANSQ